MTIQEFQIRRFPSHELYGDFWFNGEPVPISALRGQVILLDFWDYTDCSSLRALPYVKEWNKRYSQYGFVVVGVHVPKFPFGKNPKFIESAVQRLGIEYPVVMDNEAMIWSAYGNRVWPTKCLIDKEGFVRCTVTGEGNYSGMEQVIQSLLYDAGTTDDFPTIMDPIRETDRTGAVNFKATAEVFAGYLRGSIGNVEGYSPESTLTYADPKIYFDGRIYLDGDWLSERTCLQFQGTGEGHIIVQYQGLEVNAVMDSESGKPFEIALSQDGQPLSAGSHGSDVELPVDGGSIFRVDSPKMYNLVRNREFGEHVLKLTVRDRSCRLYSLSFVSSVIPELISNN